ncbi:hypothetical protein CC78DRAFT_457628 [Lojkania enalia]|uniref:T6SS Phospholipase effector Tle1-like catalytic domain-containing protein n=1 Tax=Lojkania enalia TaxID=147567 RepID=A0A9P4KEW8_9PLEO|nr:hypothetical protein CC78DRAFT_457628 [Didymosphaeria enalia]
MAFHTPSKRLVIFCDGTWCGRETGTDTNIKRLADMIGTVRFDTSSNISTTAVHSIQTSDPKVEGGYQEGIGLNKTFLEYLWDSATASTIGEECVSVYKFIVERFTSDYEIWLFGFSRGAYTVRCVAGMINNCGIIKADNLTPSEIETLCKEVYRTYRSPLDIDHPKSEYCKQLRRNSSRIWQVKRPIRFMGITDTVGSLGIPHLNAGIGFDWPEFYDQKISTVVQTVYHAVSLHDRLWIFQPCLALNGPGHDDVEIHQQWFPGCHYDLGRQKFRFIRSDPMNQIEKFLGAFPARLSKTIYPNEILSNLVLRYMLESVQKVDPSTPPIPHIALKLNEINFLLVSPVSDQSTGATGSGDVYGALLDYAPVGTLWSILHKFGSKAAEMLNKAAPKLGDNIQDLLGLRSILRILTATRDRRVPGTSEVLYDYKVRERIDVGQAVGYFCVEKQAELGVLNEDGVARYPSRSFENYRVWRRIFGGNGQA